MVAANPSERMQRREVIWSLAPRHSESRSISVASPVQENASSTGRCHEDVRNQYPFDEGSAPDNPDTVQSKPDVDVVMQSVVRRAVSMLAPTRSLNAAQNS